MCDFCGAAVTIDGRVLGGGAPVADSTVTLWAASAGAPKQLAQTRSAADGRFALVAPDAAAGRRSLYLVAKGGQPRPATAAATTRPSRC